MKKFIFLIAVMLVSLSAVKAQSFSEIDYYDRIDNVNYVGLMTMLDEDSVTLRCVQEDDISKYFESAYYFTTDKKNSTNYLLMVPVKDDADYPIFVWTWKKKDQSDFSEKPYVIYDVNELGDSKMDQSEAFVELSVEDMDEEYLGQFYEKDEFMYKTIATACKLVREQDEDIKDYDVDNTKAADGDVTMHFIMVAATKDPSIGQSVETDLNLVEPEFKKYAKQLKIAYDERIVQGSDFNKKNMEKALSNLQVAKNDIIVFVYSGHGFRFDDTTVDEDAYPNMYLTYNDGELSADDYAGVSEVFNFLVKKHARLTLVISDCCNSKVGVNRVEVGSTALAARGSNNYDVNKLKKLFLEASGSMKVTAAKAGQYALCDAQGGFLLTSLLNNIRNQISATSNKQPSWQAIVDGASKFVKRKTSEGFDESGENRDPQIVVRSIHIRQSDGSDASADSGDSSDALAAITNDDQNSGKDPTDKYVDYLCIAIPVCAIIGIAVVIILIIRKKKNRQSHQHHHHSHE